MDAKLIVGTEGRREAPVSPPRRRSSLQGDAAAPSSVLSSTTACTSTSRSTAAHRSADRCGRHQRRGDGSGAVDPSSTSRLGRSGRCRRQGAGLCQLARHPARHLTSRSPGGKTSPAGSTGSPVHGSQRREVTLHGRSSCSSARRPPDDQPRHRCGRQQGNPEGILDAVVTVTIAMVDLKRRATRAPARSTSSSRRCTPQGSGLASELFRPRRDHARTAAEHRQARHHGRGGRTSVNLKAAMPKPPRGSRSSTPVSSTAPATRCTPPCMRGRCSARRHEASAWIRPTTQQRAGGLSCGLRRRAQIGKGMWRCPTDGGDARAEAPHPKAGATPPGVPSRRRPPARLHYHQVNVSAVQRELEAIDAVRNATPSCQAAADPVSPKRSGMKPRSSRS